MLYSYLFLLGVSLLIYTTVLKSNQDVFPVLDLIPESKKSLILFLLGLALLLASSLLLLENLLALEKDLVKVGLLIFTSGIALQLMNRIPLWRVFPKHPLLVLPLELAVALLIGAGWYLFPSWVTYDLFAVVAAYVVLPQLKVSKMRIVIVVLVGIMLYDIWGVFGTGLIPKVATGFGFIPPAVILVPQNPFEWGSKFVHLIGLGDVVVGGFVVVSVARYKLHWHAIGGYAIGLFLAFLLAETLDTAIPATITIAPVTLIAVTIGAIIKRTKIEW